MVSSFSPISNIACWCQNSGGSFILFRSNIFFMSHAFILDSSSGMAKPPFTLSTIRVFLVIVFITSGCHVKLAYIFSMTRFSSLGTGITRALYVVCVAAKLSRMFFSYPGELAVSVCVRDAFQFCDFLCPCVFNLVLAEYLSKYFDLCFFLILHILVVVVCDRVPD